MTQAKRKIITPGGATVENPVEGEVVTVETAPVRKGCDYSTIPADDIDRASITRPVLSRDGWVVPDAPAPKEPFKGL